MMMMMILMPVISVAVVLLRPSTVQSLMLQGSQMRLNLGKTWLKVCRDIKMCPSTSLKSKVDWNLDSTLPLYVISAADDDDDNDDDIRGRRNFRFGFGAEFGKKFIFGLVSFSVGRAAAKFRFRPKLSVSFGAEGNWVQAASISSSELHFFAVPAQCPLIYVGFMTLIELFERFSFVFGAVM